MCSVVEMYGMKCGQIHNKDMAKDIGSVTGERAKRVRRYLVMFMETQDIVEVASSCLLFASFVLYSSSKRVLGYVSSQHGTNQYWFIINKKIQHFLLGKLARLVMGTIF